ncbi:hypothetical protein DICPUDRAFT_159333 [Dictyostelium purpureum]|uniref:G-protein coupled receptors family 2 profile 2 domain-containing protein n=1 Tax=Dictyostelium purpureum TaxID=5786 RepID=F1A3V2_DICPU|nr:uncharacterized protein DICPUDRAFT_159333 [Dictyostelium purpureum]EGC29129.1 hypothetical protein DICPUDRAFT_159333 [Dictyostelium purpureum]|eukprot:XP_003294345.1 hypothetical protein DICPUDRAFT_159333 [Dictyostelium purpureum]
MMIYKIFIIIIIILINNNDRNNLFVKSQFLPASPNPIDRSYRCEKYIGNTKCDGFIFDSNSIYVNDTDTQKLANDTVELLLKFAGTIGSSDCKSLSTVLFVCNTFFRSCVDVPLDDGSSLALPIKPCFDDCSLSTGACSVSALLDCSAKYPAQADQGDIYQFPKTENTYNLVPYDGQANFVQQCLDIDTMKAGSNSGNYIPNNNITGIFPNECTAPLIKRVSTNRKEDEKLGFQYLTPDSDCLVPCPIPFFSKSEWSSFKHLTTVSGSIAFVCVFFNIFTYGFLNTKHDRHTIGILCLSFSLWICMVSDLIVASSDDFSLVCPEPGRFARQHDTRCAANGIIFQFGAVNTVMFWSVMAFDLWLVIKKLSPSRNMVKFYIIAIEVLAVIFTILPIIWKQYGYGFGGVGCWVLSDGWQNGVFWIPLTVCLFIGTSFICLISFEIYRIVRNVGKGAAGVLKVNIRPFLIILFIFGEYVYLFIYHFYVQHNTTKFTNNIRDWVICLQSKGSDELCKRPETIGYASQFIFLFFLRLLGIEVLIFYGINTRTKRIWKESKLFNSKYFKAIREKLSSMSSKGATSSTKGAQTTTNNSDYNTSQLSVELSQNTKGYYDIEDDL